MPVKRDRDPSIDAVREFWQRRTNRMISTDDAREIKQNLAGFFAVLRRWELAAQRSAETFDPRQQPDIPGGTGE
ncbi:MAG TPA: hypothetical protein VGG64_18670 [Pirellulales bacterium]